MGGVLFNKFKFLVSCSRTCQDPVGHTSNSTVTTCADGTTEYTEDEGLGVNICCSSASALCQTGNNDGKSWNFPSYLSVFIELWNCRDLLCFMHLLKLLFVSLTSVRYSCKTLKASKINAQYHHFGEKR